MKVINSKPKHSAIILRKYYSTSVVWRNNKFVRGSDDFHIEFRCPFCHRRGVLVNDINDDTGPWRTRCANCNKLLGVRIENT